MTKHNTERRSLWVELLLRIRKFSGANLGPETTNLTEGLRGLPKPLQPNSTIASFHILPYSLFTNHSTIRRYVLTAQLNT